MIARFLRACAATLPLVLFPAIAGAQSFPYACPSPTATWSSPIVMMSLNGAWAKACGSAYIAVMDNGIYVDASGAPHTRLQSNVRLRFSRAMGAPTDETPAFIKDIAEQPVGPLGARGHGTHVAGIMAMSPDANLGLSGACPGCSLFVFRAVTGDASAVRKAYSSGAQVLNMSFGAPWPNLTAADTPCVTPVGDFNGDLRTAIQEAQSRGVIVVAASGNERIARINNPAAFPGVIAAGGVNDVGQFFTGARLTPAAGGPCEEMGSNWGPEQAVVAPAYWIPSAFWPGATWGTFTDSTYDCKATSGADWGRCSGTSMSAPHVSALVGLIRSANPHLDPNQVRTILTQRAASVGDPRGGAGLPNANDAVLAALAGDTSGQPISSFAAVRNRLTPLLSQYSPVAQDHFYTVVPQMYLAAFNGTLPPLPKASVSNEYLQGVCTTDYPNNPSCASFGPAIPAPSGGYQVTVGGAALANAPVLFRLFLVTNGVEGLIDSRIVSSDANGFIPTHGYSYPNASNSKLYAVRASTVAEAAVTYSWSAGVNAPGTTIPQCDFSPPAPWCNPMAVASVLTSHVNPMGGAALLPLYRLSWRCADGGATGACGSNPMHLRHFYTTSASEASAKQAEGYLLDGVEGFMYSSAQSPVPVNGRKLCRLYSSTTDDYLLNLGTASACAATFVEPLTGIAYGTPVDLGYAYAVQAPAAVNDLSTPVPASIAVAGGSGQTATVNTRFAQLLSVLVKDANQNPMSSVTVTFNLLGSGPGITPPSGTATTNASGIASVSILANTIAGSYTVSATVSGLAPVNFVLTNLAGAPSSQSIASGGTQSAQVGSAFAQPLSVRVADQFNNAVAGVAVTFTPPASGASATLSATTATTNASGIATVTATANGVAGSYPVVASSAGIASQSFQLTNNALPVATLVEAMSGNGQSARVGTSFAQALYARVKDQYGAVMPGVTVTFSAPSSGASATLSAASVVTNASGIASVSATANAIAGGPYLVAATASSASANFSLTNTAAPVATAVEYVSGSGQSRPVNTGFVSPLSVLVRDQFGFAMPGVTVQFAAPATGASATFSAASVVTGANGVASVTAFANAVAGGPYNVYATVPAIASGAGTVAFSLTNLGGPVCTNCGFESPAVPGTISTITPGWSIPGGAIFSNAYLGYYGVPPAPQGTQAAYNQAYYGFGYSVNVNAGSYVVSFKAYGQPSQPNTTASPLRLYVDGVMQTEFTLGMSWGAYSFEVRSLTAGTHTFQWFYNSYPGSDNTIFLDDVAFVEVPVATAPFVVNGGFEAPSANPIASGANNWVTTGGVLSNAFLATVGAQPAPQGTQAGFFSSGGFMRQDINLAEGFYLVTFKAMAVPVYGGAPAVKVRLNGVEKSSFATSFSGWSTNAVIIAIPSTGYYTLEFGGDWAVSGLIVVDDVQMSIAAPNSGTINGGFETPSANGTYTTTTPGWVIGVGAILGNTYLGYYGVPPAPQGAQVAYFQAAYGLTTYLNLMAGSYTLTFRAYCIPSAGVGPAPLKVRVNGVDQGIVTVTQSWGTYSMVIPGLPTGTQQIALLYDGWGPENGTMFFVDDVRIVRN